MYTGNHSERIFEYVGPRNSDLELVWHVRWTRYLVLQVLVLSLVISGVGHHLAGDIFHFKPWILPRCAARIVINEKNPAIGMNSLLPPGRQWTSVINGCTKQQIKLDLNKLAKSTRLTMTYLLECWWSWCWRKLMSCVFGLVPFLSVVPH